MTTTLIVCAGVVASWIAWVVVPSLPNLLYFDPAALLSQPWRLVTWPVANQLSLWEILNLFFFWYFGTNLENTIGRTRVLWLLVGIWGSLTAASTVVGLAVGGGYLAGIDLIQFVVLLIWIAEYPTMRFLFNIPAWVFGLVLVGLRVMQLLAARMMGQLLVLALGLVLVAIVARRVGLLAHFSWIPGGRRRPVATTRVRAHRPSRAERAHARAEQRSMSDRERLDVLLDQINEQGINSLSEAQRRELMALRDRLRGG